VKASEHNATEQLLVIPKPSLRGASSIDRTDRNGDTGVHVLKENTLNGINPVNSVRYSTFHRFSTDKF
jgi:hypothetical protein